MHKSIFIIIGFFCALLCMEANAGEQKITTEQAAAIEQIFPTNPNTPPPNLLQLPPKPKTAKNSPIFYSRDKILLHRKATPRPAEPLPWQASTPPVTKLDDLILDVEIRDGASLYNQSGWFNLSSYAENSGVMLTFSEPDLHPIKNSAQYATADILFIDKQGKITQIVPQILLSDLEQDIIPKSPILAFLFLKGGACSELSISAGDEVDYSLFKKSPLILNAP